ncbi:MAG TPA: DNA polymerase III subunit beta [Chitinophagaceae bacterium]|nr:DNA polymerase III subunit beta [Chitinophagaceae bacterium]
MRFITSSGTLLKNLQLISGIISPSNISPILNSFLFSIEGDQLDVYSSSGDITMKVTMDVESNVDGRVCILAKVLLEYLKNLPEQPITIEVEKDNFQISITSERGNYKIIGEDPELFNQIPNLDDAKLFTISADDLADGIEKTLVAVSNDDMRPAMSGVFFELSDNNLTLVSTDAHRLARYIKTDVQGGTQNDHFIVPRKALNQLRTSLVSSSEVSISFNNKQILVVGGQVEMYCTLIDARFPDYKVVIPAENPYSLKLNKNEFQSALKRVSVFSNKTTNLVAFDIKGNTIHLNTIDIDYSYEGNEKMSCEYQGEDMKISFNSKLLLELIQVIDSEEILFELSSPTHACLMKSTEQSPNEDLLILIMPLKSL